jgi:CheY-like chemotaxis protein
MERARDTAEPFALVLTDGMMPEMDGFELAEHLKQHPDLAGATIMMLSSAGQPKDATRCRELGVSAYLTKPIKQSDLLDAIVTVLHASSTESRKPLLRPPLAMPETRPRLRILLAEDNAINQRVATGTLQKRGHTVVVASNGKEALAALEKEAFDLLLIDVQMPEMDGFEVTRAIREKENRVRSQFSPQSSVLSRPESGVRTPDSGLFHLPIVAMTAHALKGDRERCLEAGMDGYVSKPLQARHLFEVIAGLVPAPTEAKTDTPDQTVLTESVFDRDAVLERVEGNSELMQEIIGLFFDEIPGLLSAIHEAMVRRDAKALARAAHTLKGAMSNLSANEAFAAALRLEMLGHGGDLTNVEGAYAELAKAIIRLKGVLATLVDVQS